MISSPIVVGAPWSLDGVDTLSWLREHGGGDTGPFKHSGGGDNPKPGVGDTRPSWW